MRALSPLLLVGVMVHASFAFVSPSQPKKAKIAPTTPLHSKYSSDPTVGRQHTPFQSRPMAPTTTSLQMGYRLPPSGPKSPKEQFESILSTVAPVVLVALFFASPLGGIFFAVTNSLFVLALLTPFVLFAGFQIWSALYTVEAPCPSCGALPVRALKSGEPSVCLNCGAFSRVNEKGDGLEMCNNPNEGVLNEEMGESLFDAFFGAGGNGVSDFDVVGGQKNRKERVEEQAKKAKRQGTIIDVDVERD